MADVLAKIISGKRDEVATLIQTSSMADLDRAARAASPVRGFTDALAAASASGYGLIAELKKDFTILIVTHNMQQAARCSDYTAYMYLGELMEFGDTDSIFVKPQRKETEDYITGRFG